MQEADCAIVTGGSSGVGAALVAKLLRLKRPAPIQHVFATGQQAFEETGLARMLKEEFSEEDQARITYSSGDTGDADVVHRQMGEAMRVCGGVAPRYIFINAGIGGGRYPLEEFDLERFDAIMRTNVRGVFLWLRAMLPPLKARETSSQIVITSSIAGLKGFALGGPYCASKFALQGLALSLRAELKEKYPQVKVALLCPGPIATPWWEDPKRGFKAASQSLPTNMLTPDAVASAGISIMLQDASSNIEMIPMEPS